VISDATQQQLNVLTFDSTRPLVICDVDEVVVHFTRSFEEFLHLRELRLEAASLALAGNIRQLTDNLAIKPEAVAGLIDDFFAERTRTLQPIEGAIEALLGFAQSANVVMLTNLPHFAKDDRVLNLSDHGINYPVITNSGPKGPAIKNLASRAKGPVIFVDDSPGFIQSAYDHAPHVHLIHFLQDERFATHTPHFDFVSLRTNAWAAAKPHIEELMKS
jgi:hypothetical protein